MTFWVTIFWLPLGAGGHFVRFNGRVYEAITACRERRRPLDLFHTALEVTVPEGRYVIENAWPIPDANGAERGVEVEGPVGSPRLGRFRVFRYEYQEMARGLDPRHPVGSRSAPAHQRGSRKRLPHPRSRAGGSSTCLGTR